MPLYQYTAYNKERKKIKGSIEAENLPDAKDKLRQLHFIVIALTQDKKGTSQKNLTKDSLVIFTSQLNQLIAAKIPVYECLLALEEQSREEAIHPIILSLTERVKTGHSLSRAMQDFPDCFSPLYRALVGAGEAIGNLELAFSRLTQLLTQEQKVRKQLISSLIYPLFLAGLLLVAVAILVTFVIPSLQSLFEDRAIPPFTQFVLQMSAFLRVWGPILLLAIACGVIWMLIRLRNREQKGKFQKFLLKLPITSSLVAQKALARFGRTLSTLIEGGLPLTTAMQLSEEAINCVPFEEIISHVRERMIEGRTFSSELSRYPEVPPLFCRMIKIGEDSGKLSPLLTQLSIIYEEETERTLQKIVTLTQPILLLLMGIFVGGVLLSILLPLSDFGSSLQM